MHAASMRISITESNAVLGFPSRRPTKRKEMLLSRRRINPEGAGSINKLASTTLLAETAFKIPVLRPRPSEVGHYLINIVTPFTFDTLAARLVDKQRHPIPAILRRPR